MLAQIRAFFAERDVIEVQTPTLGRTSVTEPQIESLRTGGGAFLQTSPEHYMKRLRFSTVSGQGWGLGARLTRRAWSRSRARQARRR